MGLKPSASWAKPACAGCMGHCTRRRKTVARRYAAPGAAGATRSGATAFLLSRSGGTRWHHAVGLKPSATCCQARLRGLHASMQAAAEAVARP